MRMSSSHISGLGGRETIPYDIQRQMFEQKERGSQAFMERMIANCPTFFSKLFNEYVQHCKFVGATELYYETVSKVFNISPVAAMVVIEQVGASGVVNEFGFRVTPEVVDQFLNNEKEAVDMWHSVIAGKWRYKLSARIHKERR